jgi:hypothetical protein
MGLQKVAESLERVGTEKTELGRTDPRIESSNKRICCENRERNQRSAAKSGIDIRGNA